MGSNEEQGFTLHFGWIVFVALPAVVILFVWGWRKLWWMGPFLAGLWLLFLLLAVYEDRWRIITDEQITRGVPKHCPECAHCMDIDDQGNRFQVRCPICGYKKKGTFT